MKSITTRSNRDFPLFQSHLDLAHTYWSEILKPGDVVVDATSGNGHDALFLAKCALTTSSGMLFAFDVQEEALVQTRQRIESEAPELISRLRFCHQSHEIFPDELKSQQIKLFVYNLGYLPGANKEKTTKVESTLTSVRAACELVVPGGVVSITCYPGHPEGAEEEAALLEFASTLNKEVWCVCHHRWINRSKAPSLLLLQKNRD